jgi:hypothetical protein
MDHIQPSWICTTQRATTGPSFRTVLGLVEPRWPLRRSPRVWFSSQEACQVFKLRVCLAAATRNYELPGCDDGVGRLRADAAERLNCVPPSHMCIRWVFCCCCGHLQRDEQQLDPFISWSWANTTSFSRSVPAVGFSIIRRRLDTRCMKLRASLAAETRGSGLPGCDDGDARLRALLPADAAARLRFVIFLHVFISFRGFRSSQQRWCSEFSLRGRVQRDQQQLVPVSQRSRAGPARFGRCVAPLGFGFLRRRVGCVKLRVCLAAATRYCELPGCGDGVGRLRALLLADAAARLRFMIC